MSAGADAPLDALVIGAGFSGLYQVHLLRDELGLDVQGLEAAHDVGGTWYWNRYPGARCDSESHAYAYYFSQALHDEWQWTQRYPAQPEILEYLRFVARRLDLTRSFRFGTRVVSARFDETRDEWTVKTDTGDTWRARVLIAAVGCLSSANVPDIEGRDDFAGEWYHTGEWPHDGVDFRARRVAQIGTGSSGIQAAPVIASQAAHLTVFQRTAQFSVPAHNGPLSDEFKAHVRDNRASLRELMRSTPNGHAFRIAERSVFDVDEVEREALYEDAWAYGGLRFRATFEDLLRNEAANATAADFIKAKIRATVNDPRTAEALTRIDHPYATKRPPVDSFYFETFNRDNVTLVDVRDDPIERIGERGVVTRSGEHAVDCIVFATGFDAMTGTLLKIDIRGVDGVTLKDAWGEGPKTYLGLQVAGFPNLFTITGPGSPSVLTNMPVAIEQHVEWVTECIRHMRAAGYTRVEALPGHAEDWVAEVNRAADTTLMPRAGHSWYLGANIPGKPRVFMPYTGGMHVYRQRCEHVASNGYEGFRFS